MTETSTQPTPDTREPLTINALYSHYGNVMIAVTETEMVSIVQPEDAKHVANHATELLCNPGTDEWINRMVDIRNSLARDAANERASLYKVETHLENLGEALLEKAIEKDWCEEYDEFAEEWGLPKRYSEYYVTVTVRVRARDSEDAADLVRGDLGIDHYSDYVIDGPEVTAQEAY